jgi:hypothetical protein
MSNLLNRLDLSLLAIDRVHRIGQEKTVYVTHFIVICFCFLLVTRIEMESGAPYD